jgi:hypothetical protein
MSFSFERREQFRHESFETKKIEYTLGIVDSETFEGLVINSSDTGLCLLISNPLDIGQEIMLQDEIYGFYKSAKVQWVEKIDEGQYKVGLIFLS